MNQQWSVPSKVVDKVMTALSVLFAMFSPQRRQFATEKMLCLLCKMNSVKQGVTLVYSS